jgi:hypothetical protein
MPSCSHGRDAERESLPNHLLERLLAKTAFARLDHLPLFADGGVGMSAHYCRCQGTFGMFSFYCQLPSMHSAAEPELALEDASNGSASRKAPSPLGALYETF